MKTVFVFVKEILLELKNTKWYVGKNLYNSTVSTIVIATIISLFLFGIDLIFQKLLLNII
jgi:preprotein translocase SecE subunit